MRSLALLALISLPACTCVRADEVELTACDTSAACDSPKRCCADQFCRAACVDDGGTEKSDGGHNTSGDGGARDSGAPDSGTPLDAGTTDAGHLADENVKTVLNGAGHLSGGAFTADVQLGVAPVPQHATGGSLTLEGSAVLSP